MVDFRAFSHGKLGYQLSDVSKVLTARNARHGTAADRSSVQSHGMRMFALKLIVNHQ